MKTWLAVMLVVLADAGGNICLTRGMKQMGEVTTLRPRELVRLGRRALGTPMLGLGIGCMAVAFFAFMAVLSWADLSLVQPATALGFVISVLGARYLLNERVTTARWIGTICISIGIALISLTSGAR